MPSITTDLAEALGTVRRPGDFFVTGTAEFRAPVLEVEGVGRVALPLLPAQAEQLARVAEPAPYGRGEETILDPAVRQSLQIDPDRVRLGGKGWAATLEAILARVAAGLGVDGPISASLHKLLLYQPGGFFVGHRDTEKVPGMFATLVIVLPSLFAGGELLVRHKGREARLDLHRDDPNEVGFAAFYADCVHEVLPVTEGSRLTFAYNLVRPGRGRPPQPPGHEREQARLAALLQSWRDGTYAPDEEVPEKLIYLLEHAYTPAELGFPALKGVDAAVAAVLAAAADRSSCDLHLALLTVEESGAAEHTGNYRRRGRWDDDDEDDEFEAGELFDRSVTLSQWFRRGGEACISGLIPAEDDEFAPPASLEALVPDEEHFHEATGNEGATFERTYRRAALVLWPADRRLAVLSQGGLEATLPWLDDVVRRWSEGGAARRAALAAEAHDLAGHIIAAWPSGRYPGRDKTPSDAARLLGPLTRLADTAAITRFLQTVIAAGRHVRDDNTAIVAALETLPAAQAIELVDCLVDGNAAAAPEASADLLARLATTWPRKRRGDLGGAASKLVAALPTKSRLQPAGDDAWQAPRPALTPSFLRDLLTGLDAIDSTLADRAAEHVLAWPATYGPDSIILPALRELATDGPLPATPAATRLRAAALAHLRARVAEPLAPPADWRRPSRLPCRCTHCTALARYLDDPERPGWILKANEADRRHVADTIRKAASDVDTRTDQRGRPYSLVCVKNQASYERRLAQRAQDLQDLALLGN
jgi:hypothetical protein